MARGEAYEKLPIQTSLNEARTTNNNSGKSSCANYGFGTVCPKAYFIVVKHAK